MYIKSGKARLFSIFTRLCNHHHYLILEHFHYPKKKSYTCLAISHSPLDNPRQPLIYFLSLWISPFWVFHVYGSYSTWPLCPAPSTSHVSKAHPCCSTLSAVHPFCGHYTDIPHFIHPQLIHGLFPLSALLWIMLRTFMYTFLCEHVFNSLGIYT